MATVSALTPGDLVTSGPMSAVFITRTVHPDYPTLMLVVWRLTHAAAGNAWSFDALDPRQEIGQITPSTIRERTDRLKAALTTPR
jgi:hypothetical protein